jgi:hypothetical protein
MITTPWLTRAAILTLLIMIYAIGYVGGKDAAIKTQRCYAERRL